MKRFIVYLLFAVFFVTASGAYVFTNAKPAQAGVFIGISTPNFAFSFGQGLNAYYAPSFQSYIYGYNGLYYRWYNGGWVYASVYSGQWFPLTPAMVLPAPLVYGPPPPVVMYRPYFFWWRLHVAPWYREYHPGWWARHHMYLRHYRAWRAYAPRFYATHPFYKEKMRRIFRQRMINRFQRRRIINQHRRIMHQRRRIMHQRKIIRRFRRKRNGR
jgi:hypothetical protein